MEHAHLTPDKDNDQHAAIDMEKWNNHPNKRNHNCHLQRITIACHLPTEPSNNEVHSNTQKQIDILNNAYPGYNFDLVKVVPNRSSSWWDATNDSSGERNMKKTLQ